jgi:integrase/recombinase XerD
MKIQGLYKPYIEQYLEFKRSLGYKLRDIEYTYLVFDRLTILRGEHTIGITKELSDEWCEKRPNESLGTRYGRVSQLSLFARFLCDIGIPSYVPDLPNFQTRDAFVPYIFSKQEIASIFTEIDCFKPNYIVQNCSYMMMPTLFRVLYGTGLRLGEALSLEERDVNIKERCIKVRQSKNGTERIVPMSDSLTTVCEHYKEDKRLRMAGRVKSNLFFVKNDNSPCAKCVPYKSFKQTLFRCRIPHKGKGLGPRLHDLRHTFACHSLAAMAESGIDLYHSLPVLSTYLGHRALESTEKYVRLTSEMFPNVLKDVNAVCGYIFPEHQLTDDEL